MTFHNFEDQARRYVVGALDSDELPDFQEARRKFGREGELFLKECHVLAEAFALSLRPLPSSLTAKERLFSLIRGALNGE